MNAAAFSLDDTVAVLERTPASLAALLTGLPETWLRATEGPGTWSPYDVIGHLAHGERTDWMTRARMIREGAAEPFARFDRTAMLRGDQPPLDERLAEFASLRRANLAELASWRLGDADLRRTGVHPSFGRVTLAQLLATWAVHDLDHVTQIARTMAKRYAAAVGPWTEYLGVLHDRTSQGPPGAAPAPHA